MHFVQNNHPLILKRLEAHLFEKELSFVDTSSQILMNSFIESSCFPLEYYDVPSFEIYTKKYQKLIFYFYFSLFVKMEIIMLRKDVRKCLYYRLKI
jgi:hypothetical protein